MAWNLAQSIHRTRFYLGEPWAILPSYSTGTVTTTLSSAVVTGSGTAFTANVFPGHTFHISGGQYYHVLSVDSDTQITLTKVYAIAGAAGLSYTITSGKYTNATIVEDLNFAQRELSADITRLDENYFATSGNISYVSGTERYALPTTNGVIKKIISVERTDVTPDKELLNINFQERYKYLSGGSTGISNLNRLILEEAFYIYGQTIGILPVPTVSATSNITIHYIPEATDLTVNTSTTILSDDLVDLWVLKAALKRTNDPVIVNNYTAEWKRMMATLSRDASTPRYIHYSGD